MTPARTRMTARACSGITLLAAAGLLVAGCSSSSAPEWEYQVNIPEKTGPGPDGVAVAGGAVYGDTPTSVFALNAATGKTIWGDSSLLNGGQGTFEIQPQVAGGRVYVASAYGAGSGGGVLMALDASTGRRLWTFNTVIGARHDLVFTTLYNGVLIALNRGTGAIVYTRQLPTSTNAPIAVFGNTILVPAGGPRTLRGGGNPQLVAYTVP